MPVHVSHYYLSTACLHEDTDPALHGACRLTCKFCGAPCSCPNHPGDQTATAPASWVDQARDMARRLLDMAVNAGAADVLSVLTEIDADPALFWLRDRGEQPPGTWQPPG
jgi:hypothetical protein